MRKELRKIYVVIFLCAYLFTCCQNKKSEQVSNPQRNVSSVILKYNENMAKMPNILETNDKDLITEVMKDIYSENFDANATKIKVENYGKYIDKIALSIFSYSNSAKYSLDSLAIKDNYPKEDFVKIDELKKKFDLSQVQITQLRVKTMYIMNYLKSLIEVREKCEHKFINGELTFSEVSCEDDFNKNVNKLNENIKLSNEIINELLKPR
jgi:hypothetical protein